MKTIGLNGGMSWESSLEYYRIMQALAQQGAFMAQPAAFVHLHKHRVSICQDRVRFHRVTLLPPKYDFLPIAHVLKI